MSLASYHLSTPPLVLSANRCDAERPPWCRLHGLDHHHHHRRLVGVPQMLYLVRLPGHHRLYRPRLPELDELLLRLAVSIV